MGEVMDETEEYYYKCFLQERYRICQGEKKSVSANDAEEIYKYPRSKIFSAISKLVRARSIARIIKIELLHKRANNSRLVFK